MPEGTLEQTENRDTELNDKIHASVINEVQLILAEKRTSLAFMRTGITVFALPLTVLSALIATSSFWDIAKVLHLLIPVLVICAGLIVLGSYLVTRAVLRVRHFSHLILILKKKHSHLCDILD
ncbi:MAG: hypothetical protein ABIK07_23135 [Planctomycetota bacterium]|nr:hypothetical protein [bacterium]MBU1652915.1 hypothetical protein [bacterium]